MSGWTETDRRIGMWSAASAAATGFLYVVVGVIGVVARPPGSETLRQVDPYLAILEALIIVFAVLTVVIMSAVYAYAPRGRKTLAAAALALVICFAVLTCAVHFVSLTVGRQIDPGLSPLLTHQLSFGEWPSVALSLDLLGWDFFLGLSLLLAAPVFTGDGASRVRVSLMAAGTLCLAGTLGPASGHLEIQYLGIAGYAFILPAACALLAVFFSQVRAPDPG